MNMNLKTMYFQCQYQDWSTVYLLYYLLKEKKNGHIISKKKKKKQILLESVFL